MRKTHVMGEGGGLAHTDKCAAFNCTFYCLFAQLKAANISVHSSPAFSLKAQAEKHWIQLNFIEKSTLCLDTNYRGYFA